MQWAADVSGSEGDPDVMPSSLLSTGFVQPVVKQQKIVLHLIRCRLRLGHLSCILEMSFGWGPYPLLLFSLPFYPSLWKLKGQRSLIRMQRRRALLQIENILILLMLGGRWGETQRERRQKMMGRMKRVGEWEREREGSKKREDENGCR